MPSSKVLPLPVSILEESHAELVDAHLGRQPGEPRPSENLYPPSAKPLCDEWEGPACVLGAVWRAVWAEDGLHPTRVQTGWSPAGDVSGSGPQDELCRSAHLLSSPPAEPSY